MAETYSKNTRLVVIFEFEAPLDLVWNLLADLERVPDDDIRFTNVKFLTNQKKGIGTLTYWDTAGKDGITQNRVELITEYKPREYYTYTVLTGAGSKDCTFIFQGTPQGTRIIYTAYFKHENPDILHYKKSITAYLEETRKTALRIISEGKWSAGNA